MPVFMSRVKLVSIGLVPSGVKTVAFTGPTTPRLLLLMSSTAPLAMVR